PLAPPDRAEQVDGSARRRAAAVLEFEPGLRVDSRQLFKSRALGLGRRLLGLAVLRGVLGAALLAAIGLRVARTATTLAATASATLLLRRARVQHDSPRLGVWLWSRQLGSTHPSVHSPDASCVDTLC